MGLSIWNKELGEGVTEEVQNDLVDYYLSVKKQALSQTVSMLRMSS